ncbi:MAG: hypothetical protein AAF928_11715 [Myxococcota bacterium]
MMTELPPPMENYLRELESHLSGLDPNERSELLRELRGGFVERAMRGETEPGDVFTPASHYARHFLTSDASSDGHYAVAALSPAAVRGHRLRLGAAALLVLPLLAAMGFAATVAMVLGVAKLAQPDAVGYFVDSNGTFLHFGIVDLPPPGKERLGWTLFPILVAAIGMLVGGATQLVRFTRRWAFRPFADRNAAPRTPY